MRRRWWLAAGLVVVGTTAWLGGSLTGLIPPTGIGGVRVGWQVCPGLDPMCPAMLATAPAGTSMTVYDAWEPFSMPWPVVIEHVSGSEYRELVVVVWQPGRAPVVTGHRCGGGLAACP